MSAGLDGSFVLSSRAVVLMTIIALGSFVPGFPLGYLRPFYVGFCVCVLYAAGRMLANCAYESLAISKAYKYPLT